MLGAAVRVFSASLVPLILCLGNLYYLFFNTYPTDTWVTGVVLFGHEFFVVTLGIYVLLIWFLFPVPKKKRRRRTKKKSST